MSYIPYQQKSPFAVARGVATGRYNDVIEPASRSDDLVSQGTGSSGLKLTSGAGTSTAFMMFLPSWERLIAGGTLASYRAYAGADQSEMLHCRSDNGGDFVGGLDDTALSPSAEIVFSAYSVFAGGWPSAVRFYAPRSSALVWFT